CRVEHWGDGAMRVAFAGGTIMLTAAAGRAWSAWGEVARTDVVMSFIAWALVMAALWWQMMTGMTTTRMVNGLALSALALLIAMLVLIA
ncbi:MAG: hypothetical protein NZ765_11960, partial [Anaerolineae bacterium]|nr:hypothetical protein [Anaerolineae bacterium]MDW8072057.1 hypothetical protein [Anaerolineae bacterium]